MSRIYLPIGARSKPYPNPQTERENLLNRLWEARTVIPGAREMSVSQLKDYVQRQEFKLKEEMIVNAKKQQRIISAYEQEQARGALKEYLAWKRRKESQ
jgi:hypothetical protein